jgi:hypothetical protein
LKVCVVFPGMGCVGCRPCGPVAVHRPLSLSQCVVNVRKEWETVLSSVDGAQSTVNSLCYACHDFFAAVARDFNTSTRLGGMASHRKTPVTPCATTSAVLLASIQEFRQCPQFMHACREHGFEAWIGLRAASPVPGPVVHPLTTPSPPFHSPPPPLPNGHTHNVFHSE